MPKTKQATKRVRSKAANRSNRKRPSRKHSSRKSSTAKTSAVQVRASTAEAKRSPDYYEILGVRRDATPEDVRQAFRRLAKKYHPDRNRSRAKWAEQKIRIIIQAYDTLMDRDLRTAYDRRLRRETDPDEDTYRQSLRARAGDPNAEARLILEDLLHERGDEAIEVYERAASRDGGTFDISKYLDLRDYLDCLFLLGEEYERAGNWKRALELYHRVYDLECDQPLRYFFETLKERIRDIYCKKLARRSGPLDAVDVYEKVLGLGIPKKTEAYIHKKIAESFFRANQNKKARQHLVIAFALEPKLKGAQKICEKLGLEFKRTKGRVAKAASS